MVETVPKLLQLGVSFAISQGKILVLFRLFFLVLDFLPPFGDELHHLLCVKMFVTGLFTDLFPLFLAEENVW